MARYEHCVMSNQTVVLDGNEYYDCDFIECRIIVTRGNFVLKGSRIRGCVFEFGGEAGNIKDLVLRLSEPESRTLFQQPARA